MKVHVDGQLTFNNINLRLQATLAGLGIAYLPEDLVWSRGTGGWSGCLPNGAPSSRAPISITRAGDRRRRPLGVVVDALRYRRWVQARRFWRSIGRIATVRERLLSDKANIAVPV